MSVQSRVHALGHRSWKKTKKVGKIFEIIVATSQLYYVQVIGYSISSDLVMNFPGSHKKVWKLWTWLINVLKYTWQIIRQTTRGKKYIKCVKKIYSLLGELLNVSN